MPGYEKHPLQVSKILATVVVVSPADCVHDSLLIMDMVINSLIVETHDKENCYSHSKFDEGLE